MKPLYRSLLLLALLAAALLCYVYGFEKGAFVLIALGFTLELAFWVGLFSLNKNSG